MKELLKLGLVSLSNHPEWIWATLVVLNNAPAMYRLTIDYCEVYSTKAREIGPLLHREVRGRCICCHRLISSQDTWQLPLHEDIYSFYSFMIPYGATQLTHTTQVRHNSTANFQTFVGTCFETQRELMLAWIADYLLHESMESRDFDIVGKFGLRRHRNRVISLNKSTLFATMINWRSRLVGEEGVPMDPGS